MKNLLTLLQGKKTYIVAILGGIYWTLIFLDIVPNSEMIWAALGITGAATMRAGIKKVEFLALAGCLLLPACANLETNAYRTIGSTTTTVDASMNAWGAYVRAGKATPEEVVKVGDLYRQYQSAMRATKAIVMSYRQSKDQPALEFTVTMLEKASGDVIQFVYGLINQPKK